MSDLDLSVKLASDERQLIWAQVAVPAGKRVRLSFYKDAGYKVRFEWRFYSSTGSLLGSYTREMTEDQVTRYQDEPAAPFAADTRLEFTISFFENKRDMRWEYGWYRLDHRDGSVILSMDDEKRAGPPDGDFNDGIMGATVLV